jgi:hypothetical protein
MNTQEKGTPLHEKLNELLKTDRLPTVVEDVEADTFRTQNTNNSSGEPYTSGFHFSAPQTDLGRFNDPNGKLKVCYVAQTATSALAEIFCRNKKRDLADQSSFYIGSSDLETRSVSHLKTKRKLRLLDLGSLLPMLGYTLDELTGPSYKVTQEIVLFFSEVEDELINGVAYPSRHLGDRKLCYAIWTNESEPHILETQSIVPVSKFRTTQELPSFWSDKDIVGEEILTEVLGFKVVED